MKKNITIISLLLFLFMSSGLCEQDIKSWFSFVLPWDDYSDSPTNVAGLVLDAPAGKHGFVKVENSHFYFQDGKRAKFWGINFSFGANFPNHKESEILANHLAKYGFNCVRLMAMDRFVAPDGIFSRKKYNFSDLDSGQLERLDYFIYQLNKKGIYVAIPLLAHRNFFHPTEMNFIRGIELFYPELITSQMVYAQSLMMHKNIYKNIKYAEDPGIAFVEIINEASILKAWKEGELDKSKFYNKELKQLDILWINWVKEKYATIENLKLAWKEEIKDFKPGEISRVSYARMKNTNSQKVRDQIEFYLGVEKSYFQEMLKFLKTKLNISVPIECTNAYYSLASLYTQSLGDFIDIHAYWSHPGPINGNEWGYNSFKIDNLSMLNSPSNNLITKTMNRALHNKPFVIGEWNHCFPNSYSYESPILIASYGCFQDIDGIFLHEYHTSEGWDSSITYDFFRVDNRVDMMGQMPIAAKIFLNSEVKKANNELVHKITYDDAVNDALDYVMHGESLEPFHSNEYLHSKVSLEFGDDHSLPEIKDNTSQFEMIGNALNWIADSNGESYFILNASESKACVGFIKGKDISFDNISLNFNNNGAVSFTSLDGLPIKESNHILLCLVGQIMNTGQKWNKEGNSLVDYGKPPTLVQAFEGTIKFSSKKLITIYALDERGLRKNKMSIEQKGNLKICKISKSQKSIWYEIVIK